MAFNCTKFMISDDDNQVTAICKLTNFELSKSITLEFGKLPWSYYQTWLCTSQQISVFGMHVNNQHYFRSWFNFRHSCKPLMCTKYITLKSSLLIDDFSKLRILVV